LSQSAGFLFAVNDLRLALLPDNKKHYDLLLRSQLPVMISMLQRLSLIALLMLSAAVVHGQGQGR
jgi:hypothetical protein